ncbi:MAG: hypothetical protein II434_06270 [Bacteroidales bacterium]|nr:hypothetical protein [Bacteroidales bacterium]
MRRIDRFDKYMACTNLNDNKVTQQLGLSVGTIGKSRKEGRDLSDRVVEQILNFYTNLNRVWLLTGEGEMFSKGKRIPLYDDDVTIGGLNGSMANVDDAARPTEWIDAGDWFPNATSAIHHYGDSMTEYPSGCILALKRVNNWSLLINGENYVIETDEFRITKQVQDDGDCIVAYSSNTETYPDGRLIHAPIRIPKESIRHLDLVLGCVIRKFSAPIMIR